MKIAEILFGVAGNHVISYIGLLKNVEPTQN
jgi:hypothetical protein